MEGSDEWEAPRMMVENVNESGWGIWSNSWRAYGKAKGIETAAEKMSSRRE